MATQISHAQMLEANREELQVTPQHEGKIVRERQVDVGDEFASAARDARWTFGREGSLGGNDTHGKQGKRRGGICGLSATIFWIVVAVVVLLLAAAVGAGVGGGLAARRNSRCPAGTDRLADYSEPADPATVTSLDLNCPASDGTSHKTLTGGVFTIHCAKDIPASNLRVGVYNILAIRAFSLEDCMEACGAWNWYGGNQTKTDACVGVVLSSRMAYSVEAFYGNCWLKMGRQMEDVDPGSGVAAILDE